jgi:hypothetical protein
LKKIVFILTFIIGINFTSFAQNRISQDNGFAQAKLIKFYPNPASTAINFDFQRGYDKSYTLQIYNFIGKKVYETKNLTSRNIINLSDFFRGIYFFQLRDKSGLLVESGKFQIVN